MRLTMLRHSSVVLKSLARWTPAINLASKQAVVFSTSNVPVNTVCVQVAGSPQRPCSTLAQESLSVNGIGISETLPAQPNIMRVVFSDSQISDFSYIWLRDNCPCSECVHPETKQKLIDTPELDISIKPRNLRVDDNGQLCISWPNHESTYNPEWLHKFGKHFQNDNYHHPPQKLRPPISLWDSVAVWKNVPEVAYRNFMETEDGLIQWLELLHKFGLVFLRDVPTNKGEILNVANRIAYVKETSYGVTFDVVAEPDPKAHLAYTGRHLAHHTDMNYREKSPGLQMLHCLRAEDLKGSTTQEMGGKSFFADGFFAAEWLRDNYPSAFHILSSMDVRFNMLTEKTRYSQDVPVICVDKFGEVLEVHVNNRTMGPLQFPSHLVQPFYHAYRVLVEKIREESSNMTFHLVPGDLVAFNNRRILHGRTFFDPSRISRHLQGCYVDIDEAMSKFDSVLLNKTSKK